MIRVWTLILIAWCTTASFAQPTAAERGIEAYARAIELAETDRSASNAGLREAIAAWTAALDEGEETAELHRAIGTAAMQLGETGRAVLSFRRAERLNPTDQRVRESLAAARSRVGVFTDTSLERRAAAVILFWRGHVARSDLLWIGALCWSLAWVALASRALGLRGSVPPAVVLLAVSLLSFASLGLDELSRRTERAAVVTAAEATGYRGPSATIYEKAFDRPLVEGVEVTIRQVRDGWAEVDLSDGRSVWIRREFIEPVVQ